MNILNAPSPGAGQSTRETRLNRPASVIPALGVETVDVLRQMSANLDQLEDLSRRLGFVLADVRAVVRR